MQSAPIPPSCILEMLQMIYIVLMTNGFLKAYQILCITLNGHTNLYLQTSPLQGCGFPWHTLQILKRQSGSYQTLSSLNPTVLIIDDSMYCEGHSQLKGVTFLSTSYFTLIKLFFCSVMTVPWADHTVLTTVQPEWASTCQGSLPALQRGF